MGRTSWTGNKCQSHFVAIEKSNHNSHFTIAENAKVSWIIKMNWANAVHFFSTKWKLWMAWHVYIRSNHPKYTFNHIICILFHVVNFRNNGTFKNRIYWRIFCQPFRDTKLSPDNDVPLNRCNWTISADNFFFRMKNAIEQVYKSVKCQTNNNIKASGFTHTLTKCRPKPCT